VGERRPGFSAFANVTLQESLAAKAVNEGNRLGITSRRIVDEHSNRRWTEVIALYCGLTQTSSAVEVIEQLKKQPNTKLLSSVLGEAYLACSPEIQSDSDLRQTVIERIAAAPVKYPSILNRFHNDEVAPIANRLIGNTEVVFSLSEAYGWLPNHPDLISENALLTRLETWRAANAYQLAEANLLLHCYGSDQSLLAIASEEMYSSPGVSFSSETYVSQAELSLIGIAGHLESRIGRQGFDAVLLQLLRALSKATLHGDNCWFSFDLVFKNNQGNLPGDKTTWKEFALLVRQMSRLFEAEKADSRLKDDSRLRSVESAKSWVGFLEAEIAKSGPKSKSTKKEPAGKRSRTKSRSRKQ